METTYEILNRKSVKGNAVCERCGKTLKNLYCVRDCANEEIFVVGSECVKKYYPTAQIAQHEKTIEINGIIFLGKNEIESLKKKGTETVIKNVEIFFTDEFDSRCARLEKKECVVIIPNFFGSLYKYWHDRGYLTKKQYEKFIGTRIA